MTCLCKEGRRLDVPHRHTDTNPQEPCLYCAEKHLATAAALARELGYAAPNRGYIIGELAAACWHLYWATTEARELSAKIRDFRHRIQSREEDEACTDFSPYLAEIDALIREEMRAKMETEATP